jgi:hypothetical protein
MTWTLSGKAIYLNVPCMVDLSFNKSEFYAADIHMSPNGISIVGDWYGEQLNQVQLNHPYLENTFSPGIARNMWDNPVPPR